MIPNFNLGVIVFTVLGDEEHLFYSLTSASPALSSQSFEASQDSSLVSSRCFLPTTSVMSSA